MGNARPIDGRPQIEAQVRQVVASFCYLGDMLSAGGGCEMAVTTRVKTAWNKFRELLPVLTSLLQDQWPCVQLLRAERHTPCQ